MDQFQARDLPILLLSLKAGGNGAEPHGRHPGGPLRPVVESQRWRTRPQIRAYRIGQDQPVTVHRLVTEGTVEDKICAAAGTEAGVGRPGDRVGRGLDRQSLRRPAGRPRAADAFPLNAQGPQAAAGRAGLPCSVTPLQACEDGSVMAPRRSFGKDLVGPGVGEGAGGRSEYAAVRPKTQPRPHLRPAGAADRAGSGARTPHRHVLGSRDVPDVAERPEPFLATHDWDQLAQLIAAKASHSAALLSGELPALLRADARAAGIELLPQPGDLGPDCACPDWGDPCKHSAALCYMAAELIDSDPFVLLLLRGRDRASVLRSVRAHRSGASAEDATTSENQR